VRQAARLPAVAFLGVLAACGGSAATGTSGTTGTTTGPTTGTATATTSPSATGSGTSTSGTTSAGTDTANACGTGVQITVKGSTVTPPPGTTDVKAGCQVDLTITADRTSEVHVHVVDLEKTITAGQPLHITFTPTQQGVYEIELHDPDLLLAKLAVR
jgi:hypothetical protein